MKSRTAAPIELKNVSVVIKGETTDGNVVEFTAHRLDPENTNIEIILVEELPLLEEFNMDKFLNLRKQDYYLKIDAGMVAHPNDPEGIHPIFSCNTDFPKEEK